MFGRYEKYIESATKGAKARLFYSIIIKNDEESAFFMIGEKGYAPIAITQIDLFTAKDIVRRDTDAGYEKLTESEIKNQKLSYFSLFQETEKNQLISEIERDFKGEDYRSVGAKILSFDENYFLKQNQNKDYFTILDSF